MTSVFSKFVKKIVSNSIELEHPDENTMKKVIKQGQNMGLSPEDSWLAYLTAGEYKSLGEQEMLEGGTGCVAKKTDPELLRLVSFGEKRK